MFKLVDSDFLSSVIEHSTPLWNRAHENQRLLSCIVRILIIFLQILYCLLDLYIENQLYDSESALSVLRWSEF